MIKIHQSPWTQSFLNQNMIRIKRPQMLKFFKTQVDAMYAAAK